MTQDHTVSPGQILKLNCQHLTPSLAPEEERDDSVNTMLQNYSQLLQKIHLSVRSLTSRLEDLEKSKAKKVKHYKKKLAHVEQQNVELANHC